MANASAADFEVLNIPGVAVKLINMKGEIVDGDADKFLSLVDGSDRVTVLLESPGGLVREALEIGAEIRIRNFATMVTPEGQCYSACGLIWVSGARRYMSQSSQIGFYAAYREQNGEYRESGVANAEIGSYLTHLGLRIEAIRFFTIAGPNDFLMLTPERARALGIDVYEQNGLETTTPDKAPTADVHAMRWMSYVSLQSHCANLLGIEKPILDRGAMDAFEEGNRLLGSDKWVDLWTRMLDGVKTEVAKTGPPLYCIQVELKLRAQGLQTGVDGPSYNCSAAQTLTETTLCANEELWSKDRALSSIYHWVRKGNDKPTCNRVLAVQRRWLSERNLCGGNARCLNEIYDMRLNELKDLAFPN